MSSTSDRDQTHPLEKDDRQIVKKLLQEESTNYNLAELARLRMRYQDFPGARDIQQDLELVLNKWELTEAQLYEKTFQIHTQKPVYQTRGENKDRQDWS
jgi:hypothetical protein